ncbi:hypothetical protein [Bacillus wiedmannii]|uniref:hypothetical protein n=1 Tax=Bacillus wiedmannii TaxID=1890302 RepID=UPI000BFA6A46|nr:hypothetical protein [Bacillus wiedmannii]PGA35143.1 hypothetical protein COL74_06865 [Bacillus wiedmannii]PHB96719.1 hypothetical protein COE96_15100 [Bacillus wiedmannii]
MFDKDEIMDMAMNADNPQGSVILVLLFDGVSHQSGFDELINLAEDNIDEENQQIVLENRTIPMSTETVILVRKALEENVYVNIKDETSRRYKIADGINILRGLRGKAKVKGQIISQRILRMAEIFDYPYLNATTVSYSGQLYYTKQLLESGVGLDNAVSMVLQRFGIDEDSVARFSLKQRVMMDLAGEEIPLSQEYFWTQKWQEKIEENQKDIAEGSYKRFNNVEELFRDLDSDGDDN